MSGFQFGVPVNHAVMTAEQLRDNFEALGTTNATAQSDKPDNPRNGTMRIYSPTVLIQYLQVYWDARWKTLLELSGSTSRRDEKSFSSSTNWVFDHNLGVQPLVQCISDLNNEVFIPLKVEHASVNRVIVTHTIATSGTIIVVG